MHKVTCNKQKLTSNKQKVTSNEQKLTSNEQKVTSNEQKVTSNEQKVQPRYSSPFSDGNIFSILSDVSCENVFFKISKSSQENTSSKFL